MSLEGFGRKRVEISFYVKRCVAPRASQVRQESPFNARGLYLSVLLYMYSETKGRREIARE
jgi:hypothetical protein